MMNNFLTKKSLSNSSEQLYLCLYYFLIFYFFILKYEDRMTHANDVNASFNILLDLEHLFVKLIRRQKKRLRDWSVF